MGDVFYNSRSAGWAELAVSPKVREAVEAEAARGKAIAEGLSADFIKTGDYAGSFEVTSDTETLTTRFGTHEVAAGVLTNTSGHAAAVEYGYKGRSDSETTSAHHVLGRTLAAMEQS